jgi:hypothetical protein
VSSRTAGAYSGNAWVDPHVSLLWQHGLGLVVVRPQQARQLLRVVVSGGQGAVLRPPGAVGAVGTQHGLPRPSQGTLGRVGEHAAQDV